MLELEDDVVYEAILSVYDLSRKPSAAPMGFWTSGDYVYVSPYKSSNTYRFLDEWRACAINLCWDVELFLKTALKEVFGPPPPELFEPCRWVDAPRLRRCVGCLELYVRELRDLGERALAVCEVAHFESEGGKLAYTRGFGLVIEALVYATKASAIARAGEESSAKSLAAKSEELCREVCRILPNTQYSRVAEELLKALQSLGLAKA